MARRKDWVLSMDLDDASEQLGYRTKTFMKTVDGWTGLRAGGSSENRLKSMDDDDVYAQIDDCVDANNDILNCVR